MKDKIKYRIRKDESYNTDLFSVDLFRSGEWFFLTGSVSNSAEECRHFLEESKARNFQDTIVIEEGEI